MTHHGNNVKTSKPQIGSIVKLAKHAVVDIKNINRFGLGIVLEITKSSRPWPPECKVYWFNNQFNNQSFSAVAASLLEVISQ